MSEDQKKGNQLGIYDFIFAFMFPTAVGKVLVLYFGLNYGNYPGRGYGYGLAAAIAFTVFMIGRLIWKYRDYED